MPCDTVTTSTLDLKKANKQVLEETLISLGLKIHQGLASEVRASDGLSTIVTWTASTGMQIRSADAQMASKITSAYSKTVILAASRRFGWRRGRLG